MSRILLCGAFGQSNPGDDALLEAFVAALADHELVIAADRSVSVDGATVVPPTARSVGRALGEVDALAVAGGTIFKTLHPSSGRARLALLARTHLLVSAAHARGTSVAMVGVGAGRLDSRAAAHLARSVADRVDLLVLRDEESAHVLAATGASTPFRIGSDPAWALIDPDHVGATDALGDDAPVIVALSHLASDDADALTHQLVHVVEPLVARGIPVQLQPWQGHDGHDARLAVTIADAVARGAGVEISPPPSSLADAVEQFRHVRAVVGLRHHSLVAAAAAGRPFLALAHEPKLAGLARRLGQTSVPPHAPPAVLARTAVDVVGAEAAGTDAVRREIALAHQAFRLLRLVVSGGADDESVDEDRLALTDAGRPW